MTDSRTTSIVVALAWLAWLAAQFAFGAWIAALLPLGATLWALRRRDGRTAEIASPLWRLHVERGEPRLEAHNAAARSLPRPLAPLDGAGLEALLDQGAPPPVLDFAEADGGLRHLELHAVSREGGAMLVAGTDAAARVHAEQRVRRLQAEVDEALAGAHHVLYRIDAARAAYDYISPAIATVLGLRMEQLTADDGLRAVQARMPAADLARLRLAMRNACATAHDTHFDLQFEYRLRDAEGRLRWFRDSMRATSDEDGRLLHVTGAAMEVTDARMAEARLRVTLHSIGDAVVATDADGRITLFNPRAVALTGWSEAAALGRGVDEVLRFRGSHEHAASVSPVRAVLEDAGAGWLAGSVCLEDRNGRSIPVAHSAAPLQTDEDGGQSGAVIVLRDERGSRESLERLHESEARYRTLVESSPVGIFHFDTGLAITFLNQRFAEILDTPAAALIGSNIATMADQSVIPAIRAALGGQLGRYEGPYHSDARTEDLRISIRTAPVFGAAGQIIGGVGIVEDYTAKYEAERKLRESETRHALAMRGTNEGLWDWDPMSKDLFLSSRLMALMGEPAESIRTTSDAWMARLHPEDRDRYYRRMVAHLKGESEHFECEFRLATQKGDFRWFRSRGVAQRDDRGLAYRMVGSIGDITARKRAQMQLTNELAFSRALVDSLPVGLCVARRDGSLTMVNEHLARLTALPVRELHRLKATDWIAVEDRPVIAQRMERAFAEGSAWAETTVLSGEGERVPVHFLARRVTFYDTEQLLCIASDISERKQAEAKMRDLNRELERRVEDRTAQLGAAVKELEAFSYSVSHDLRSPLRAIDGYARILREDYREMFTADAHQLFERMLAAVARMSELIDDLLELSRVSRRPLKRNTIDLSAMARRAVADLEQRHAGHPVEVAIDPGIEVCADPKLLQIALENLLGNAWKFTARCEAPMVRFCRTVADGETIYSVEDNGAGFDMRYADKLFGAFQRLHTDRDFEGTGIGLATVSRIIQRHGGRVWAEGEVGRGARFYFTLGDIEA